MTLSVRSTEAESGNCTFKQQVALVLLRNEARRRGGELPIGQHQQPAVDQHRDQADAQQRPHARARRRPCRRRKLTLNKPEEPAQQHVQQPGQRVAAAPCAAAAGWRPAPG